MATLNKTYARRLRAWIMALRSGKFRQTRLRYHGTKGGHCCLGVAQIVGGLPKEEYSSNVKPYYGLGDEETNKLIGLNDHDHRSFDYIADRIEKKILPRFLTK